MRILKMKVEGLNTFKDNFEIDFSASQRVTKESREFLIEVQEPVYTNPVIELAGLNASGKTISLQIMQFVMTLLKGRSINRSKYVSKLQEFIDSNLIITVWFYLNDKFYVLKSVIEKMSSKTISSDNSLFIKDEWIFAQARKLKNKTEWRSDPSESDTGIYRLETSREDAGIYISDETSIMTGILRKSKYSFEYRDFLDNVNRNELKFDDDFIPQVVQFLDPNIEYLQTVRNENGTVSSFLLKFKANNQPIELRDLHSLQSYLSSGTIKGINLFTISIIAFQNGDYILVDELENHFNIEITKTLIRFFLDPSVNHKGATLVFSTHYPELLDIPPRNDALYVLQNDTTIRCKNMADLLERSDGIKRSEAFISSIFHTSDENSEFLQTAPSYEHYLDLKKAIPEYNKINKTVMGGTSGAE